MPAAPLCRYYHASKNRLPVGKRLTAKAARLDPFERLVDAYAPPGAPTRRQSFFLAKASDELVPLGASSLKNMYHVRPVGVYMRADANWIVMAHREAGERGVITPRIVQMIERYWNGKKSPGFVGWEYSAPTIVICKRLDEPARTAALLGSEQRFPGILGERVWKRMLSRPMRVGKVVRGSAVARELGLDGAMAALQDRRQRARRKRRP